VAALIEEETRVKPEIVEGGRGEFTVWVGDERVAQKTAGEFPSDQEVLSAVRQVLAGR
jgi:hypothetical protein